MLRAVAGPDGERTASFDPERYWSDRLEQTFSLGGVGWLGLGEPYNRWMYAVRRRVFRRVVHDRLDLRRARVLDVGSGTGFYVSLWGELGAGDVTGSDLTGVSVERLRSRFPGVRFEQIDISSVGLPLDGPYDAISAMDVLYHIVDDDRYAQALRNIADLLTPGGRLIFTDNLLHGDAQHWAHGTSRSLDEVTRLLGESGLEIELRRPVFFLMNTPVDSKSRVLKGSWRVLNALARFGAGRFVGAVLFPVDLALGSLLSEGPSTEIVVCRKVGAGEP